MSIQKCVGMANSSLGVDTAQGTLVHSGQTNDNALCGLGAQRREWPMKEGEGGEREE